MLEVIAFVVLGVLLVLSVSWNVIATKRALALDSALTDGAESVEECLDKINEVYGNVNKILQSPLASNDPKVIQIHKELKRVHDSLLVVANRLVSSWNDDEDEQDDESDD